MNVIPIEPTGFAPTNAAIANHLRKFADWIDAGQYGDMRTVVVVMETMDGDVKRATCGHVCDLARVVGLLAIATQRAMTVTEE